jgi:hypothetical protein
LSFRSPDHEMRTARFTRMGVAAAHNDNDCLRFRCIRRFTDCDIR